MYRKTLTYSTFIVTSIFVVLLFVTARNYIQLGIAVVLYPFIAYFALKLFPRKARKAAIVTINIPPVKTAISEKTVTVNDIDKRAFLKIIGAAGISFFLFSLIGKKVPGVLGAGGGAIGNGTTRIQDADGETINPSQSQPTDGYKISEIDDNVITYYGFTNKDGAWLIMKEDTDTSSFRYAKGDASFPISWSSREHLRYDYFHNVF